jgi:ABC-type metal ion transport system, periplasmic component/surface adhesin
MRHRHALLHTALIVAATVALAGCSGTANESPASGSGDRIPVVASTDVWGDVAAQIGGDRVRVTSIINDPSKDPHEYQADPRNQLEISRARVVIVNGGGYDDFMTTMLDAAGNHSTAVLNAADISGYDQKPAAGSFNEHVWYDFPTVDKVADRLSTAFSKADPKHAAAFQKNADAFAAKLKTLENDEAALKAKYAGRGVAITEPVPLYMLDAVGLANRTPEKFSEAIENGTDVPPSVLSETLALFSTKKVDALVYNEQTGGAQTDAVLKAARAAGIPDVPVTETLPAGKDYIGWMTANLNTIGDALAR